MKKIIYKNDSGRLEAELVGDMIEIKQFANNELTGEIFMYVDEMIELKKALDEFEKKGERK